MKYVGKKILSIVLVTAIVSTLLSAVPLSQVYAFTSGDWKYEIVGNEVTITGYVGEESKVTVPSTIDGKVVTAIGNEAFFAYKKLTNITIPNCIMYIGSGSFFACENLTSITFSNSIISIGNDAFNGCKNLRGISLPNSIKSIGNGVFMECEKLTSITIPSRVTSISNFVFFKCFSLKDVKIPIGVTAIGNSAFSECEALTSITIPSSVRNVEEKVFENCINLKTVKFMGRGPENLSDYMFGDGGKNIIILYPEKYADSWAYYKEYSKQSHNDVEIPVSTVTINKKNQTILKGKKYRLQYSITPSNADDTSVKWSSSNKKVATVSQSGVVKAKGQGKCKITVVTKEGNKKASCNITVTLPISKIKLNKQKLTINKGKKYTLKVRIKPSNVKVKTVSWSSSNKKVATVSKGKVKAIRKGTCYITAKAKVGGKKAKCKITVK